MKYKTRIVTSIASFIILTILMLDPKTASLSVAEGIELCIKVLIPSLFPFFIITTYMNSSLIGLHLPGIQHLGKLLRIPSGGESMLLLGLIGGYPVGAQLIGDTYHQGLISKRTGKILLGYCNNAGPAFIFGVASTLFTSPTVPILLWVVHLLSAVMTGLFLPKPNYERIDLQSNQTITLVKALQKSIHICLNVCSWVITFKIVMAYIENWMFNTPDGGISILLSGFLELSNGCLKLLLIRNEAYRFILCAAFLAFGGICVTLQTSSATERMGLGLYIPGKIMQTCLSIIIAVPLSYFLFPYYSYPTQFGLCTMLICMVVVVLTHLLAKKVVAIPEEIMYNSL